jgi:hypothetical protein
VSDRPIFTDTGERFKGLPVVRFGSPGRDDAKGRRDRTLSRILAAESKGEPVTDEMKNEAWEAKVEYFRHMGWPEPKIRPGEREGGSP